MRESESAAVNFNFDIVIFGGGIAGLWLLNQLCNKGFNAVLFEARALGDGQSVASQGIIHGGLKYALSGSLTGAANAIAGMPAYWRNCLLGRGEVDLSAARLLSEHYFMWSSGSLRSRLKTFLGSKTLRGKIDALAESQYPTFFSSADVTGSLYQLSDFVIDTVSLIETLSAPHRKRIFQVDPQAVEFTTDENARVSGIRIRHSNSVEPYVIKAQRCIFTAGEGNQALMNNAGLTSPAMQLRPLKMTVLKKQNLPLVYVHCVGDDFSLTPVLTLTSHLCQDGEVAWYLGGELAESGVNRIDADQIRVANDLLKSLFPHIPLAGGQWRCFDINRAEGRADNQHRPDSAFLQTHKSIIVAWPTKFTLSPALAESILAALKNQNISPRSSCNSVLPDNLLASPAIAKPPWETLF